MRIQSEQKKCDLYVIKLSLHKDVASDLSLVTKLRIKLIKEQVTLGLYYTLIFSYGLVHSSLSLNYLFLSPSLMSTLSNISLLLYVPHFVTYITLCVYSTHRSCIFLESVRLLWFIYRGKYLTTSLLSAGPIVTMY